MTEEEMAKMMYWCGKCTADIMQKRNTVPEDIMRAYSMIRSEDSELANLGIITMIEVIKKHGYDP
jgi:hypothetical protein